MTIRRATADDALLLATHRAAVWHEVGDWSRADLAPALPLWTDFIRRTVTDGTYVAFVAHDGDGRAAGSGALLIQLTIPRPGSASDRSGRVQSVYVEPGMRRRGIARAIMGAIIAYAGAHDLVALTLHPSDDGRALYASLGFERADEMILRRTW